MVRHAREGASGPVYVEGKYTNMFILIEVGIGRGIVCYVRK